MIIAEMVLYTNKFVGFEVENNKTIVTTVFDNINEVLTFINECRTLDNARILVIGLFYTSEIIDLDSLHHENKVIELLNQHYNRFPKNI